MAEEVKKEIKHVKATAKYVRISPRKARKVIDLVRGKLVNESLSILKFLPQKGARIISKVIKSAQANAENNFQMNKDRLIISSCYVNQGPSMKRYLPRAMGRATPIKKRLSHITIIVEEIK